MKYGEILKKHIGAKCHFLSAGKSCEIFLGMHGQVSNCTIEDVTDEFIILKLTNIPGNNYSVYLLANVALHFYGMKPYLKEEC